IRQLRDVLRIYQNGRVGSAHARERLKQIDAKVGIAQGQYVADNAKIREFGPALCESIRIDNQGLDVGVAKHEGLVLQRSKRMQCRGAQTQILGCDDRYDGFQAVVGQDGNAILASQSDYLKVSDSLMH